MDTIEVIICILSYFDVFEIVKCSSINKLFYKASDDQDIWMKIFNHDFCYNGIFSLPTMEQNLCDYKQIYKKYYCMTIRKNLLFKHDYTPKNISCLSQLSPNIKYTAKYYPADIYRGCELYCQASNENYDGIRNIKILLFAKRPFDESLIKLIKMVRISIGKRYIALYNIGLMIMRKLNIIELSETCHETNNLCHEINIQLNTKEHLMFTMNNKSIEIEILFMDDNLLQSACVMIEHILLEEEQLTKIYERKNYFINFTQKVTYNMLDHSSSSVYTKIYLSVPPIGIFIYLMNKNYFHTKIFEFDNMMILIDKENVEIQRKEILNLENVYYIPLALEKNMEQRIMKIKECCWHNLFVEMVLQINNIKWDNETPWLVISPLCYHQEYRKKYSFRAILECQGKKIL